MYIPVIKQFHSERTPWEIYQVLYHCSKVSFFFDSHDYSPPNQVYSYLGADPFLEVVLEKGKIRVSGKKNFKRPASELLPLLRRIFKQHRLAELSRVPFFMGGAVGYWGYELATLFEKIKWRRKSDSGFPRLYLGFYREMIVYDHAKKCYWLIAPQKSFQKLESYFKRPIPSPGIFKLKKFQPEISRGRFENMVKRAKNYIAAGDVYQANLSQRFSFDWRGSSLALYDSLRKINPSPFASFLKIGDIEIVSSSPERLIRKRGRDCETLPIAGTRPRGHWPQEDHRLERELFLNEKERAEHIMLVDLERNDLGRVCDWRSVKVEEIMKIEKYSHVIHLVSKIVGKLKKGRDAFDLIRAMFPGGTITGCPKIRCMQIIDELEPWQRGIYTGSIGYIDFRGDLDLNIVIRTLLLRKKRGYLQVGAGIVHDSTPAKEYEETLHKGEALAEALAQLSSVPLPKVRGSN